MEDSSFGRLIGVLTSPGNTFAAIRERPTWLVAMVLLVLVGVFVGWNLSGKLDFEQITREAMAEQGRQMSEDDLQRVIDIQEKVGPIMMIVAPLLLQPVLLLLLAVVFLVVFKLMGGEMSYAQSLGVTVHSMLPRAVLALLALPAIFTRAEIGYDDIRTGGLLPSNLAAFAPEDAGPALITLLSSIDLFSLWVLALLIIGYSVTARVSKSTATLSVGVLWVLYVLGKVGFGLIRG